MRTIMARTLVLFLALAGAANTALADGKPASSSGSTSVEEILRQARQAIGGEDALRTVEGLAAKGKYRRVIQDRDISGEREFEIHLPDKFKRSDSWVLGGMAASAFLSRTLNGSEAWTENSSTGGNFIIRNGAAEKPTKEQLEQMEKAQAAQTRAEFARYVLGLLLNSPQGYNLSFSYAGEAVADDGGRADVVDASGADGFAARLFLDKGTHLPLMLSYRGPRMRVMTVSHRAGDDRRKREDAVKEAEEKMSKEQTKPEEAEYELRFDDYRKVGSLLLPHRITQAADGAVNEEWEIKAYEINPQFKADKFQKK